MNQQISIEDPNQGEGLADQSGSMDVGLEEADEREDRVNAAFQTMNESIKLKMDNE